jgi:hypothetical protein
MNRSWLILEALALTLPATLLLAAGLPIAAMAVVALITTLATDAASFLEGLFAVLPYYCGLFAWIMLWYAVLRVASGRHLVVGPLFWAAAGAGFVASLDFLLVAPQLVRLLVCAALWVLAAHVVLLGVRPQTQRGPLLA